MKYSKTNISIGSWITLAHPAIAEIMAKAGFEWLVVDLEHSVITIREAEELIRVIDLCGSKPYVRLTANNADLIKRVMDAGAQGIIVPMVNSKFDVQKAHDAMYYPPKGKRGVGLARAQGYGANFHPYLKYHQSYELIVQIEHIDAVNNLDEILSFNGLTGFIIGPYDLSASMGIPGDFTNPKFQTALQTIHQKSIQYPHIQRGIHLVEPCVTQLKKLIGENYQFIAYSLDIRLLDVSIRTGLEHFNQLIHSQASSLAEVN